MNKIKELEERIRLIGHEFALAQADLEALKQEPEWPQKGDGYWIVDSDGEVLDMVWTDDKDDNLYRSFSNIFRTEEEAETHALRVKIFNKLWQMADDNNTGGWFIDLRQLKAFNTEFHRPTKLEPIFPTGERAQAAIDAVRDDVGKLND